ncbi:MAG: glycosyltransferase [Symploca sp. SIO2D2]|nr:glycosyltransferase [Symploca sp. SIO2D2]
MPDFSISAVIPSYNRIETLPRAIESVLAQTHPADEIIVVDDGSNDGTASFLQASYPQIKVITQANQGVSSARNRGIKASACQWVALLDSDDAWMPEKLAKQVTALRNSPDSLICHTEEKWIFRGNERPVAKEYRKRGGWIFEQSVERCSISPSSTVMSRSLFDELGYFDESFPFCEDYDLWLRITSRYETLLVSEALTIKHGGHPDQLSANRELDRYRIFALQKILESQSLSSDQIEIARTALLEKCAIYRKGLVKYGRDDELSLIDRIAEKHTNPID